MLDAKEQGAQRPEESTIIPFSESRYRSSDVKGALTDGRSPSFISVPSGDIVHYTLLRKVVRQARHLCAQSAALMCLMGTPHTPLYARRTVRITGTSGGFPSPRKAAPTQRIMMPSSPGEGAKRIVSARSSVNPSHHARNIGVAAGAPRLKRWGEAPFSINEGRPQWGFARVFKR